MRPRVAPDECLLAASWCLTPCCLPLSQSPTAPYTGRWWRQVRPRVAPVFDSLAPVPPPGCLLAASWCFDSLLPASSRCCHWHHQTGGGGIRCDLCWFGQGAIKQLWRCARTGVSKDGECASRCHGLCNEQGPMPSCPPGSKCAKCAHTLMMQLHPCLQATLLCCALGLRTLSSSTRRT